MKEYLKRIEEEKVIAIIREDSEEEAYEASRACINAGMRIVEITMNTPGAENLIRKLSRNFPDIMMGAGTVLSVKDAKAAVKAGAKFIVSPHTDPDIIKFCNNVDIIACPGTTTPTEIFNAYKLGADIIKVFPISNLGGVSYIKNIRGPLPHIRLMPTGGIKINDINNLISAGCFAIGLSGDIIPKKLIKERAFSEIESLIKEMLKTIKK